MKFGKPIAALLILSFLSQVGCYDWEMVRPAEAPKLGGSFAMPVAQSGNTTVVAVRVVDVQRPDGSLVQLKGAYDLRVTLRNGQVHRFDHPVGVTQDGDVMVFRGGNVGETRIALSDIDTMEASQYSFGKSMALSTLGGLALVGLTILVIKTATKD